MKLPSPGTEAFRKLGPQARKLSRWRSNSEPIQEEKQGSTESLEDFLGGQRA